MTTEAKPDDKKPARALSTLAIGGKIPESIPVSLVIWKRMTRIPGDHGSESVEAGRRMNGAGAYSIAYLPLLQLLEVTWHKAHGEPDEVGYAHISLAQHWQHA